MKQEHIVQAEPLSVLDRIKIEYADLVQSRSFSLEELFSPQDFQFDEFCKTFSIYPQSEEEHAPHRAHRAPRTLGSATRPA